MPGAEVLLAQEPVFSRRDAPTIVGPNDGNIWQDDSDFAFVGLTTSGGRSDWAAAFLSPHAQPVGGGRIRLQAAYDSLTPSEGLAQRLAWSIESTADEPWTISGVHEWPLPEATQYAHEWTIADSDPVISYTGAMSSGLVDWPRFSRDLASGVVQINAYTHGTPGEGTHALHQFAIWVTPAGSPVTRLYPRDDGRGMSSAPRIYPPSKARRIVGGYQ